MVYDPYPPYTVLATSLIDFPTMQRLVRFARYWDLVANSGPLRQHHRAKCWAAPFENFMAFSDWIYTKTDATHRIALDRLARLVAEWLQVTRHGARTGDARWWPAITPARIDGARRKAAAATVAAPARQARHLAA